MQFAPINISRIYWFAYFNKDEPSVRYRAIYPLQFLHQQTGIPYSIVHPGYDIKSILYFIQIYFSALLFRQKNSVIVFQKIYTNNIYGKALKFLLYCRPKQTLYDIDDAEHTRRSPTTMHYFLKRCSCCAAGSEELVSYCSQFNDHVSMLTSPVIQHQQIKTHASDLFEIGWIGYYKAHRLNLYTYVFPALLRLPFSCKLTLLGVENGEELKEIMDYFKDQKLIQLNIPMHIDWQQEEDIYARIKMFDIGVSPLIDNEFNRSKSAFKLKQCLSCGVPVLASPVGENKRFIQEGMNGYLCEDEDNFFQQIKAYYEIEETTRHQMQMDALACTEKFDLRLFVQQLQAILNA